SHCQSRGTAPARRLARDELARPAGLSPARHRRCGGWCRMAQNVASSSLDRSSIHPDGSESAGGGGARTGRKHGSSARWSLRIELCAVVLVSAALFSAAAVVLGQDVSWDTLNYHAYNPHAWLHGRLHFDLQPAMRQTYFNPLLDVPF